MSAPIKAGWYWWRDALVGTRWMPVEWNPEWDAARKIGLDKPGAEWGDRIPEPDRPHHGTWPQ